LVSFVQQDFCLQQKNFETNAIWNIAEKVFGEYAECIKKWSSCFHFCYIAWCI